MRVLELVIWGGYDFRISGEKISFMILRIRGRRGRWRDRDEDKILSCREFMDLGIGWR